MKLLVSNDDGVASPGLWALADGLRDAGHEVVVVAPAQERSGSGAAIGYLIPGEGVAVSGVERPGWEKTSWAVDGPPALCVLLALRLGAFGDGFQAVVSGVNPGFNTGTGVIHSGTVGAVLTAGTCGLPGLAVSIAAHTAQVGEVGLLPGVHERWPTAVALAVGAVDWLATQPPLGGGAPTMLNLNVPNRPLDEVPGVRMATLGPSDGPSTRGAGGTGPERPSGAGDSGLPPINGRTEETGPSIGQEPGQLGGLVRLELGPPAVTPVPGSDNAFLALGFATLSVLSGIGGVPGVGDEVAGALSSLLGDQVGR